MKIMIVNSTESGKDMERAVLKDKRHEVRHFRQIDTVIRCLQSDWNCQVLVWHLSKCVGCPDFREDENIKEVFQQVPENCLPRYRIGISDGESYRDAAKKASIEVNGRPEKCFHTVETSKGFEPIESCFVSRLEECIKELDVINPLLERSSCILNALLPLHIVLQALESGDEPSKYKDICTKCEGSISKIPELVTELAKLYPGKHISHLGKVSTEAAEVCNSIAERKGKDVPGERIEKLLEDIDKVANILREMIQQVTPDTNAK